MKNKLINIKLIVDSENKISYTLSGESFANKNSGNNNMIEIIIPVIFHLEKKSYKLVNNIDNIDN